MSFRMHLLLLALAGSHASPSKSYNMKAIILLCVVGAAFAIRDPVVHTCLEKPDGGRCLAYVPSYYYDPETGKCEKFIYGGCEGNGNRYWTEEACLENCQGIRVKQEAPDVCSLDKDPGMCLGYFPKFYYDHEAGECKKFIYGGCQGNGNNFKTQQECEATCAPIADALASPDCTSEPDTGRCKAYIPSHYYDPQDGQCKQFIYGGCGGNGNNFKSKDACEKTCGGVRSAPSACDQKKEIGPCKAAFRRFYYNKTTGQCEQFIYGGCQGNDNNFQEKEDCEAVCVNLAF